MREARRRRPIQIINMSLRAKRGNLKSIINRQSRGFASGQRLPLPLLRVARIVTEFCARTTTQNGATPCAQRNREFFARRVFHLFNCCTNGTGNARNGGRKTEDGEAQIGVYS